jgi:hypothetical protein
MLCNASSFESEKHKGSRRLIIARLTGTSSCAVFVLWFSPGYFDFFQGATFRLGDDAPYQSHQDQTKESINIEREAMVESGYEPLIFIHHREALRHNKIGGP